MVVPSLLNRPSWAICIKHPISDKYCQKKLYERIVRFEAMTRVQDTSGKQLQPLLSNRLTHCATHRHVIKRQLDTAIIRPWPYKLVRGGRPAFDLTLIKSNGINYYFQRLWQSILKCYFSTFIILSWLWNVVKLILKLKRRSSISKSREIALKAVGVLVSVKKI